MKTLGDRLKYLREKKDLKQTELAKIFSKLNFNITSAAISQYEYNKRVPDASVLTMYADYFNVTIDWILGRKKFFTGEELLKHVPEEYKESFKKLNINQLEFVRKMADEEIDPDVLIDTMKRLNDYFSKMTDSEKK